MAETGWQDISTVTIGDVVDVYVWGLLGTGLDNGFRWTDVKVLSLLPQRIGVWHEANPDDGDGYWREHELSENGQLASHWLVRPEAPDYPVLPALPKDHPHE